MSDDDAEQEEQPGWLYDDNAGGFMISFGKYRDAPQPIRDCDIDWLTFCAMRGRPSNYVRFVQAYHRYMAGKIDYDHENPGEYIVSFGRKHKGHPLQKVRDRKWLRWIIKRSYMKAKYPYFVTVVKRFLHVDHQHFEVIRDIGERVDLPEYDSTNEEEEGDEEDYEADIREDQSDSDSLAGFVVPDDDLGDAQSEDDNASNLSDGSITVNATSKRRKSTKHRSVSSDDSDASWLDEGHRKTENRNDDSEFCDDDTRSNHDDSSYEESETSSSTSSSAGDATSADSSNSSRSSTLQPEASSSTHDLGYTFRLGQQHVSWGLEAHVNEATRTPRRGRYRRVPDRDANSQSECDETLYSTGGSKQSRRSERTAKKTFSTWDLGSSFRMGGHLRQCPEDDFLPFTSKRKGKHIVGDDESDSSTEDEQPAKTPRKRRRSPTRSVSTAERRSPKTPRKRRGSPSRSVSPTERHSRTSTRTRRVRSPSVSEMVPGCGSTEGDRNTTPRSENSIRRSKARTPGSFSASSSLPTPQSMRRLGAPSSESPVKRRLFLSHVEIPPTPHLDRTKYRSIKEIMSSSPPRTDRSPSEAQANECKALEVTPRKRKRSTRIVSSEDEDGVFQT